MQAAGKVPLDATALGIDLLTVAGHKFHGPLGAAALVVRRRVRLQPLVTGGHQERSRRAGTENLPAIAGMGMASVRAAARLADGLANEPATLGERLWSRLRVTVPSARLHGEGGPRLASIVNVSFPGVDGEALLHELDTRGITVSTGSACSAASPGPSPVLLALGVTAEVAHSSVRFSTGESTTAAEIEYVAEAVQRALASLRALADGQPAPNALSAGARVAGSRT